MNRARRGIRPHDFVTQPDKVTTALATLLRHRYPALGLRKPPWHAKGESVHHFDNLIKEVKFQTPTFIE
jgi:hypothetical protein